MTGNLGLFQNFQKILVVLKTFGFCESFGFRKLRKFSDIERLETENETAEHFSQRIALAGLTSKIGQSNIIF